MAQPQVDNEQFAELLESKLGDDFPQALTLFSNYGHNLSWDVTNMLLIAADQGKEKVAEILSDLGEHWKNVLQYQHPDIRGHVDDWTSTNPTQVMFLRLCKDVLKLRPSE